MLGKLLGLVTAGVFVGAAIVEIAGFMKRKQRASDESLPPHKRDEAIETQPTCPTA